MWFIGRVQVSFVLGFFSQRGSFSHSPPSSPWALLLLLLFSPLMFSSVMGAYSFPFVWGLMAGLRCCASHGSIISVKGLAVNSGSPWILQAPNLYFSDAVVNLPKRPPLRNGHFLLSPRWPLWRDSAVLKGIDRATVHVGNFRTYWKMIKFTEMSNTYCNEAQNRYRKAKRWHGWAKLAKIKTDCIQVDLKNSGTTFFKFYENVM